MEWLKKNGALALGVGMPIALIVFFALAAWLPTLFYDPPKYDVLYLTNYYGGRPSTGLQFEVRDQHVTFRFVGENFGNGVQLYRFSPVTGKVKEIPLHLPANMQIPGYRPQPAQSAIVTPLSVPEVEGLTLDTSYIAPDGYEFQTHYGYGDSSGLVSELFFSPHNRNALTLVKGSHIVRIPGTGNTYYGNVTLIGWVVP